MLTNIRLLLATFFHHRASADFANNYEILFSSLYTLNILLPPSSPFSLFKHNVTIPTAPAISEP